MQREGKEHAVNREAVPRSGKVFIPFVAFFRCIITIE